MSRIPDDTLQDKVRYSYVHDHLKHGIGLGGPENLADEKINQMSNAEFLEALSNALEERLREFKKELNHG
jgi:hypothetical protein